MIFSSLAVAASRVVKAHPVNEWMFAACVRVVVLGALLGVSGVTQAATDAAQVVQVMKAEYDRPGQPLSVDPVSVEGAFAIAGWSQGGSGGRALLQRTGKQWQIVLCAGDALLQPATLTGAGMATDAAVRLVAKRTILPKPACPRHDANCSGASQALMKAGNADSGGLSVSNAWARATPAAVTSGAAYFTITNHGKQSDTLESITSPAAAKVEVHRTSVENGLSRMRPADGSMIPRPDSER